jgi:hypothetical protein
MHILQHRDGDLVGEGHVEIAGNEGEHRGRAVRDDRVFDTVEIRFAGLPVIRVARDLDRLVRLELDKFVGTRADRMLPHLGRRHMAGVDRAETRGEQRQKRGLRPF